MRRWRLTLVILAGLVAAVAATVLAVALNVATGGTARWFPAVERFPLWWTGGATAGVAGAGLLVWWSQRRYDQAVAELVPAVQRPEAWMVGRPAELNQIVDVLRREATAGITAAVHGAGGFGKTTIAEMVRADPRVQRHFRGRIYRVTVGRDVRGQKLTRHINGLIMEMQPDPVTFTSVQQAADHLAAVLSAGPPRLLIIDDVWTEEQLAAFPVVARCARLVTTRSKTLASAAGVAVKIGQMSAKQARTVLLAGLDPLPPLVVQGLIRETGQWPLMMGLVNKILHMRTQLHEDISHAAEDLLNTIRQARLQVDELTDKPARLDVSDPEQRRRAIRATIEASTGLLLPPDRTRLAEVGVFTRDEVIPAPLVAALWQATGGLGQGAAETLCARLADLALVTLVRTSDGGAVLLHEVIREFLHEELGPARLQQLHQVLLDIITQGLPAAAPTSSGTGRANAWRKLPESARYIRDNLIEHLIAAGQPGEAERIATDLRWIAARLEHADPAAPYTDLALIRSSRAQRLRRLFGQAAHLLAPTDPPHSRVDILCSRVSDDPDWGPQVRDLQASRAQPALVNRWPLPDLGGSALRRTLAGHTGPVTAVAIAPDGIWLATTGDDGTARIWYSGTGQQRGVLAGHTGRVTGVAIAPDGTWLATGGEDMTVRIWDADTGDKRAILTGHTGPVTAVAIAPDGTWLATGGEDMTVRIWDADTGDKRAILTGHTGTVTAVAIAPDGTWLAASGKHAAVLIWQTVGHRQSAVLDHGDIDVTAVAVAPDNSWLVSGGYDGTVWIWDLAICQKRLMQTGSALRISAVAVAPDGTWFATGGAESTQIWDPVTGRQHATLTGHASGITGVAIAPDSSWLATTSFDGTTRIWEPSPGELTTDSTQNRYTVAVTFAPDATWLASCSLWGTTQIWDTDGQQRFIMHTSGVLGVAIAPDGTWLATVGFDATARIWDAATGQQLAVLTGHHNMVRGVAIAPDGTWLATAGDDGSVLIWDAITGQQRAALTGHAEAATAVAIAPDGTWLATTGWDGTARIWDVTGSLRAILTGHSGPISAVAIAPDGIWLATAGHDGTARIWDRTGRQRHALTGHTDWATGIAVAPDSTLLATASADGTLRIWDPGTGQTRAIMRVDDRLEDCAWSSTGQSIAAAGAAGVYHFTYRP